MLTPAMAALLKQDMQPVAQHSVTYRIMLEAKHTYQAGKSQVG